MFIKRKKHFRIILSLITLQVICLSFSFCVSNDLYFKSKFEKEVMEDERIEKLLFMNSNFSRADDDEFIIGLELKDGRRIAGQVEGSIYNFFAITEIDNYKIEVLELLYMVANGEKKYRNYIVYREILYSWYLKDILNNPLFNSSANLNSFLDCYDEIKEFVENIYNEDPIPGSYDEIGKDLSRWGEEEDLMNYTGYFIINENEKIKIYVKKII